MAERGNPLLSALPPETDYLSYLTILEYNLTKHQLPLLHDILQDTTLTANIGWDLVHLLLPLLPESSQCLHDVARLGNPREVVLKVTELLEEIGYDNGASDEGYDRSEEEHGGLSDDDASPSRLMKQMKMKEEDAVSSNEALASVSPTPYLRKVEDRFGSGSQEYERFMAIVQEYQRSSMSVDQVYKEIFQLSQDPDLIEGFETLIQDNAAAERLQGRQSDTQVKPAKPAKDGQILTPIGLSQGGGVATVPQTDTTPRIPTEANFIALLKMLSELHPRIKTSRPSRFLATSLKAVLSAYGAVAHIAEATESVIHLITSLSGSKRPNLPPRKSSAQIPAQRAPNKPGQNLENGGETVGTDEAALQQRLLQSFLTYTMETYMGSMPSDDDIPGLAWASRYREKTHPDKIVPGRKTYVAIFTNDEQLLLRDRLVGQLAALARDLGITQQELLAVAKTPETEGMNNEDELPSYASDISLSGKGSLYLLSGVVASHEILDARASGPVIHSFPDFATLVGILISGRNIVEAGKEPAALVDTICFLGLFAIDLEPGGSEYLSISPESSIATPAVTDKLWVPPEMSSWSLVVKSLARLSAASPSPTLRYHSHLLASSLLRMHPSHENRLDLIIDVIKFPEYDNLKVSAIEWLKNEVLAADREYPSPRNAPIFVTPAILDSITPYLMLEDPTILDEWKECTPKTYVYFQTHVPFFLAVLNFIYLITRSGSLSARLDVTTWAKLTILPSQYTQHLIKAAEGFATFKSELGLSEEEADVADAQLDLLKMTAGLVTTAIMDRLEAEGHL